MRTKKVLVIGDSHTHALSTAISSRKNEARVQFKVFWLMSRKGRRGDISSKEAFEIISKLQASDLLVITILGTAHNALGLLQHDEPFDIAPRPETNISHFEIIKGSSLIPRAALWDSLQNSMTENTFIPKAREAARCNTCHLFTPPPKEDNNFIMESTKRYQQRSIADRGVGHPSLRLKLWQLEMEVLGAVCAKWGVSTVPTPNAACTREGFLKPEYYAKDATHGNEDYGELVLQQLEQVALT